MSETDKIIFKLFTERWCGEGTLKSIDTMKAQLYKSLSDQLGGYWSGHTAYHIMIDGGFLKDAKHVNGKPKHLTELGESFTTQYTLENEPAK